MTDDELDLTERERTLPKMVVGDASRLEQILFNILKLAQTSFTAKSIQIRAAFEHSTKELCVKI